MQHTSLPCPSPTPRAYSNSCPLSWWYQPTISSSVIPFPYTILTNWKEKPRNYLNRCRKSFWQNPTPIYEQQPKKKASPETGLRGKPVLDVHWKDWCWSWNSNTLATWCKELTYWKRPWCWERLKTGGEEVNRGWGGWMASLTQWTWVWVNSGSWWWTGRPGVLWFMGLQRVGHDSATELNWTELKLYKNKQI